MKIILSVLLMISLNISADELKLKEIIAKQNINYDVADAKHLAQATEDLIEVINAFVDQDKDGNN